MKLCKKCNTLKDEIEFNKNITWCKLSMKEYNFNYRKTHKRIYDKEYFDNYYKENKEKVKKQIKIYQEINKDSLKLKRKIYREENKEKFQIRDKIYREKNKEKLYNNNRIYRNERRKNDINFKLECILRIRLRHSLEGIGIKSDRTKNLIGCDINFLKEHLQETAIKNGYLDFDINNYSGHEYHIDHIIPCDAFNMSCSYHQKLCFNWSNLQILTAKENLSKANSLKYIDKMIGV
jgi:hypothetical protein